MRQVTRTWGGSALQQVAVGRERERGSNSKDVSKDNAGDMSIFGMSTENNAGEKR